MISKMPWSPLDRDPWAASIDLRVEDADETRASVRVPCAEFNLNMMGVMHGGITAGALVRAGELLLPGHRVLDVRVDFLRPVKQSAACAEARLHKRTRNFGFTSAELRDEQGVLCATGQLSFASGEGRLDAVVSSPSPDVPEEDFDSAPFGAAFARYLRSRDQGMFLARMTQGTCEIVQQATPEVLGHDGAVTPAHLVKLIDSAGGGSAVSHLAELEQAATVGMQVSFCAPVPTEPLRAIATTVSRYGDTTVNDVRVVGCESGALIALGLVTHLGRGRVGSKSG